ncbi:MAG: metal-dependent hydrolase [Hyphomicrobium sp.]|nr:MAG: metal-dependent hydrolase [Hyphomicrobium sp.]
MTRQSFTYGDERIDYDVLFSKERRGKIAIHVHPDASVQVDAPEGEALAKIHKAVLKRARWIGRHVNDAKDRRRHVLPRAYVSGETHFYLGRRYALKVHGANGSSHGVKFYRGAIHVTSPGKNAGEIKKQLRSWYRERATAVFAQRFEELSGRIVWLRAEPKWRLVAMKTQWGSCSPQGAILLNPHLIKAPRECIDYVILHELCHLREHNHSQRYYRLLSQLMPRWKSVKARLDGMAELLLNE